MKDNFSTQAAMYAQFRPRYTENIFKPIVDICVEKNTVWDCATGNGQAAVILAQHFKKVFATDLSQKQIGNAMPTENITYSVVSAESAQFDKNSLDLIVVAQAVHWFNFEKFYAHANAFLKKDGIIALVGYGIHSVNAKIDAIVNNFYAQTIGAYWDSERKHIEQHYTKITFPFNEIKIPETQMHFDISFESFIGYLNSWSAVQHFKNKNNYNPVELIEKSVKNIWGESLREISFPVFYRVGKKL